MTEILKWKVGATTITRLVELEAERAADNPLFPTSTVQEIKSIAWLFPNFCKPDGSLKLSVHALLVDAPGMRLIVDTCVGDGKARALPPFNMRQSDFLQRLNDLGWPPESVDAVICTHMHVDHVGWNTIEVDGRWVPTFPNARYYFAREEYECSLNEIREARSDPASVIKDMKAVMSDSVQPIFDAGLAVLVDADARISPEIRLIPTPGHTPAHVSVVIESEGEQAIITGDMMHHPAQIARPDWHTMLDCDFSQSSETRKTFLKGVADTATLLIGTHFMAPTAGYIHRDTVGYRLEDTCHHDAKAAKMESPEQ